MPDRPAGPLVTVAMPVYNAGAHLRLAVLSILSQTHANWELLIIDDGSTDASLEGIADILDPRITLLRDGSNRGLAARLNEAIDLARGQFLARMDQDDVSYPGRFASQLARFQGDPGLDLLAVRAITISDSCEFVGFFPSPLSHEAICSAPWRGFHLPHPTWMGRIGWFRKHRYRIPESYLSDDQELLLRSYRSSRFACVDEIQFAYRIRDRIRLGKHLRIRWTVLRFQAAAFIGARQYGYVLRAGTVFCLRIALDARTSLGQALFPRVPGSNPRAEATEASRQWEDLKAVLWARAC